MLQINLSALNPRELRQLLDASRRRGDAALSYRVLQEMQVRREGVANGAAPHVVELEPPELEDDDDLPPVPASWRPHADAAAAEPAFDPAPEPPHEPEPALTLAAEPRTGKRRGGRRKAADNGLGERLRFDEPPREAEAPLGLGGLDPEPARMAGTAGDADDLRMGHAPPPPLTKARKPKKPAPKAPLGFAIGLALGAALGWGVAIYNEGPPPASPPVQTAAVTAPAAPAASAQALATAPIDAVQGALTPNAETPPTASAEGATAPPSAALPPPAQAAPPPAAAALPPAPSATPAARPTETAGVPGGAADADLADEHSVKAGGCAAAPTPADRTICGDPDLQKLQKDLRRAYADALAAHQDRALLRQRQLAWRDERSGVSDPERLAKIYRERIRKLDAATAQAQHLKGEAPR